MKTYDENMMREVNTALRIPSFKNGDGVEKLVASMPGNQALGEWELHTPEDMRWNDYHQYPIKYWRRDIHQSMRWFMRQLAHAEHLIFASQRCFNSDAHRKHLYVEMKSADLWWETQVRRDTRG
jgi:hypothetical protein